MLNNRVRVKLFLILLLGISLLGFSRPPTAKACSYSICVELVDQNGEPMGYACRAGSLFGVCDVKSTGCNIIPCAD